MQPLNEAWEKFQAEVIDPRVDATGRKAMREAFFAGAFTVYAILKGKALTDDKLGALELELLQFRSEVLSQRSKH